jgi:hypothetical protein
MPALEDCPALQYSTREDRHTYADRKQGTFLWRTVEIPTHQYRHIPGRVRKLPDALRFPVWNRMT